MKFNKNVASFGMRVFHIMLNCSDCGFNLVFVKEFRVFPQNFPPMLSCLTAGKSGKGLFNDGILHVGTYELLCSIFSKSHETLMRTDSKFKRTLLY